KEHGYFMPQQFENEANPVVHAKTTGREIVQQMEDGLDAFISGVGTGGTLTGVAEVIKKEYSDVQVYAVETVDSAVLYGNDPRPHNIQGIGACYVPNVLNTAVYDDIIQSSNEEAYQAARQAAQNEGELRRVSAGAAIAAATKEA